ncbi:uncharacterized protein LOC135849880 isoform X3 [Planococcus citri]|uniref:uncharacterized protein LOC135849880 isoform X3 n=1 Tax=Planococcus citri TaxID=170843 RepID=UPI0031F736BC
MKASPAECLEPIPSAIVETILQSSSDSESSDDASINPKKLPVEPVKAQEHSNDESNNTKTEYYGRNRICYVCQNSGGDDVRFFSFPSNAKMFSLWTSACNIDPDRVFPGDLICSRHFRPEDIPHKNSERKRYVLRRDVVPIRVNEMVVLDHDYSNLYSPEDPMDESNQEKNISQFDSPKPELPTIRVDCEPNNNSNVTKLHNSIENVPCDVDASDSISVPEKIPEQKCTENKPCEVVVANDVISVPENIPEQKCRRWPRRYVGEFKEEDMDDPRLAKLFYTIATQHITKKRRLIHNLHKKVRSLRNKLELPCKRKLSEDSSRRKKLPRGGNLSEDSDSDYEKENRNKVICLTTEKMLKITKYLFKYGDTTMNDVKM